MQFGGEISVFDVGSSKLPRFAWMDNDPRCCVGDWEANEWVLFCQ